MWALAFQELGEVTPSDQPCSQFCWLRASWLEPAFMEDPQMPS